MKVLVVGSCSHQESLEFAKRVMLNSKDVCIVSVNELKDSLSLGENLENYIDRMKTMKSKDISICNG
jgi:histidinol phosphatase-like PHP family hydrolase